MRSFRFFALASATATYFLIFIGGLVRVAGAGLGCPDWPKCFGSWIPPLSRADLPAHIDPYTFNITLAWIEYGNRLVGMVVGLLILTTALLALRAYRQSPRILYPSLAAAVMVAFQGWLGGVVVATELKPILVSAHLLLAFATGMTLLYVILRSYQEEENTPAINETYPARARLWLLLLGLGAVLQILLGAQVRGRLEMVAQQYPLLSSLEWISSVGSIHDIHMIVGMILVTATLVVGAAILKLSTSTSSLVRLGTILMMTIAILQGLVGLVFISIGLEPLAQLLHLWFASILIGTIFVVMQVIGAEFVLPLRIQRMVGTGVIAGVVLALIMSAGAFAVIQEANLSRSNIPVNIDMPMVQIESLEGDTFATDSLHGRLHVLDLRASSEYQAMPAKTITIHDLAQRYSHSDKVDFLTLAVGLPADSVSFYREYASQYQGMVEHWKFMRVAPPLESDTSFTRLLTLSQEYGASFLLLDQMGRFRGYYRYDSPGMLDRLDDAIRYLARESQ